ncbi:DUF6034 family protein, partial [Eubacteriales bacterium OttesenSCG-928-N14]|nr:DUF6034 family protein [Eubacteriales bacterium OttesenSCG-928-N14]
QQADAMLQYFVGDAQLYDASQSANDQEAAHLRQMKEQLKTVTDPEEKEFLQQSIAKFESTGISAEDMQIQPASRKFETQLHGSEQIEGYAKIDDEHITVRISNDDTLSSYTAVYTKEQKGYTGGNLWFYEHNLSSINKGGNTQVNPQALKSIPLDTTKEQAQALAEDALTKMGIGGMALADCSEVYANTVIDQGAQRQMRHAWQLTYTRSVGGIPLTLTEGDLLSSTVDEDGYAGEAMANSWPYEYIRFYINERGIVEFYYSSPMEVVETIYDSAALLPFADIGERTFTMGISWYYNADMKTDITLHTAQLGMMRILEKNSRNTALLVPVWDFYGSGTYVYQGETYPYNDPYTSYLTINAIDGSVINRQMGY